MAIQALASIVLIMLSTSTPISGAAPFNPTLEWTCEPSAIFVAIRTSSPFLGIAHSKDKSLNCTIIGNSTTVTKMIIPIESEDNQCGVKYNKNSGLYWIAIEVHEHKLLILEQDRIFNVTCDKSAMSLKIGDDDGDHLIQNDDMNSTDVISATASSEFITSSIEFNLELLPIPSNNDDSKMFEALSEHDVGYGESYNMNVSFKSEIDRDEYGNRFRAIHCNAEANDISVELIDSRGCSINKKLMTDFVYMNGSATAKIPSMFRFPNSKTMKLECKLLICQEFQICRPSCDRKMDDPIAEVEDAEMIAHLLGMDDESVQTAVTGPMQSTVDEKPAKKTSTIVHVLDRREIPQKTEFVKQPKPGENGFFATKTPAECTSSEELLFIYGIVLALTVLLGLSLLVNCCCCCCCRKRMKETDVEKLRNSIIQNECWITGNPCLDTTRDFHHDGSLPAYIDERHPSISSYATVKQRLSNRPVSSQNPQSQPLEMSEPHSNMNSFRPSIAAPSPPSLPRLSFYDRPPNQPLSSFAPSVSAGSSSGTSTWSPGRNSQIEASQEASSIL